MYVRVQSGNETATWHLREQYSLSSLGTRQRYMASDTKRAAKGGESTLCLSTDPHGALSVSSQKGKTPRAVDSAFCVYNGQNSNAATLRIQDCPYRRSDTPKAIHF